MLPHPDSGRQRFPDFQLIHAVQRFLAYQLVGMLVAPGPAAPCLPVLQPFPGRFLVQTAFHLMLHPFPGRLPAHPLAQLVLWPLPGYPVQIVLQSRFPVLVPRWKDAVFPALLASQFSSGFPEMPVLGGQIVP